VQGADLTRSGDASAPRVPIIAHPDVRRSLLTQKAYAEGLRALYFYTAAHQDSTVAQKVSGADDALAARVSSLLLPIVKGVGSERAYQCLTESLQTLGGSGYLQDYPVEQYIRDAKIDSLYEGTTAIQAQDFVFRKVIRDQGVALGHMLSQIQQFVDGPPHEQLGVGVDHLRTALADVRVMTSTLVEYHQQSRTNALEVYRVGMQSVPYLLAVGDLVIGWLLLWQADVALNAIERGCSGPELAFYEGKVTAAKFFAANMLPRLSATAVAIQNQSLDEMALATDAF